MSKNMRLSGIIDERLEGEFIKSLPESGDIRIEINSPGGDVFAGFGIYNKLQDFKGNITIDIIGLAASAASFIAMAGDEILMRKNAKLMIHNPFTGSVGDSKRFKELGKNLEDLETDLAEIYSTKTGIDANKIKKLMQAETWFTADKAVADGFADKVIESSQEAKNTFIDLLKQFNYQNIPQDLIKKEYSYTEALKDESFTFADVKIGDHIYSLSKERLTMLNQFVQLTGKESPEAALAYVKELIEKPDNDNTEYSTKISNLENEIKLIKADNETKQSLLDSVTITFANDEIAKRKTRLHKAFDECRIDGAQLEKAENAYVNIEPDKVKETQERSNDAIEFIESMPPQDKLLKLKSKDGTDGDVKQTLEFVDDENKGKAKAQEVNFKITELRKENKDLTYSDAYNKLKETDPELIKSFELGE